MKNIGFVVAMQQEAEPFIKEFGFKLHAQNGCLVIYTAEFIDAKLTLVVSGIGMVCSTIATAQLIYKHHVEHIYNIGSCGAHHKNIKVGDIVCPDKVYLGDFDLSMFGRKPYEVPSFGEYIEIDADHFPKVTCFSMNRFVTERIAHSDSLCEGKYIVEMELYAIAATCKNFGVPLTTYKIVSDNADAAAAQNFDFNLEAIMTNAVCSIKQAVSSLIQNSL